MRNQFGQNFARPQFAVNDGDPGFGRRKSIEPFEEVLLAGVGTEAAKSVDFGFDHDFFAVDTDECLAIDEAAAERLMALIADDEDVGLGFPKVGLKVVEDPTGVAHASAGHDKARAGLVIDFHGILGGDGKFHGLEVVAQRLLADEPLHAVIEQLAVAGVDIGGLDRHGAVEEDGEGADFFVAEHPAQQAGQQLSAADREGGDEDFTAFLDGVFDDRDEFLNGFGEGAMVVVAVSGFEEDQVGVAKGLEIAEDGDSFRAEIAREHNAFLVTALLSDQLDAGRTKHVAGLSPNCLKARGNINGLEVRDRFEALDGLLGMLRGVERFEGRFSGALAFTVAALGITDLDASRIAEDEGSHLDGSGRGKNGDAMAPPGEERQPTGVVEMAVSKENGVQFLFGAGGGAIKGLGFRSALKKAAIHQYAGLLGLNVIGRTGDFAAGGAKEGNFHNARFVAANG